MLRNILMHLDDSDALTDFVPQVLQLARNRQVDEITAVAPGRIVVPITAASLTLSLLHAREREMIELLNLLGGRLKDRARGFRLDWRAAAVEDPTAFLLDQVARSDLVVVRQPRQAPTDIGPVDVGRVLLAAGRPVLIAPRNGRGLAFGRVVVAYKNTREARVALAAAVPLLIEARRVLVVGVGPDIRPDDLADAVGFLGCHGVFAEPHRVPDGDDMGAAEVLMAIAEQEDADCIVCGGYGHGRARELVFGGVTRELLSRARRPCLFAH